MRLAIGLLYPNTPLQAPDFTPSHAGTSYAFDASNTLRAIWSAKNRADLGEAPRRLRYDILQNGRFQHINYTVLLIHGKPHPQW